MRFDGVLAYSKGLEYIHYVHARNTVSTVTGKKCTKQNFLLHFSMLISVRFQDFLDIQDIQDIMRSIYEGGNVGCVSNVYVYV